MDFKLCLLVGSSEGLLSMEVTSACFSEEVKLPLERERLKMFVKCA